jgi:hypothetical protein
MKLGRAGCWKGFWARGSTFVMFGVSSGLVAVLASSDAVRYVATL